VPGLEASNSPVINLSEAWTQVVNQHSFEGVTLGFRKAGAGAEAALKFTVRSFSTSQSKASVKTSFASQRMGWTERLGLPGVDQAFERDAHGTHEVEALVNRSGHYCTLRMEANSDAVPAETFDKELREALSSVDIP
jgi:hypothetical protein